MRTTLGDIIEALSIAEVGDVLAAVMAMTTVLMIVLLGLSLALGRPRK